MPLIASLFCFCSERHKNRAVVKADVKSNFAQTNEIFKKPLDRLIETYTETHPDFVAAYKAKRVIFDLKTFKEQTGTNGGSNPPPA